MKIPLTQGKFTVVDACDYEFLSQWKWCYSNHGYVVRNDYTNGQQIIYMHRVILERMGFKNFVSDHINQVRFDNRRSNLRPATASQNQHNASRRADNTSGYKGVYWSQGKWRAQIRLNKKQKHLGRYDTKLEAARAYNEAALKYHGKFACLNEI